MDENDHSVNVLQINQLVNVHVYAPFFMNESYDQVYCVQPTCYTVDSLSTSTEKSVHQD